MNTALDPATIRVPAQLNVSVPQTLHDDYRAIKSAQPDLSDNKIGQMLMLGNRDTTLRDKLLAQPIALADLAKRLDAIERTIATASAPDLEPVHTAIADLAKLLGDVDMRLDEHLGDVTSGDLAAKLDDLAGGAEVFAGSIENIQTSLVEIGSKLQKLADVQPSAPQAPRTSRLVLAGIGLSCLLSVGAILSPFAARRDTTPPAPTTDPALVGEVTKLRETVAAQAAQLKDVEQTMIAMMDRWERGPTKSKPAVATAPAK